MNRISRLLLRTGRRKLYGLTGSIPKPEKWLFIVGCYNSGTTLLNRLLARHPQIGSMRTEGQFFTDQLVVPQEVGLARSWALQPDLFRLLEDDGGNIDVNRIKKQWQRAFNDSERPVLMEKSPPNAARIRWLNANFENSYFIAILRDPYATIEGMIRKAGLQLENAAYQWEISNRIMLSDLDHVPRTLLLRYESLTDQPGIMLDQITEFLGLDKVEEVQEGECFKIHEREEPIRNLNSVSLERLSTADIMKINTITEELQKKLGYPKRERTDG